MGIVERLEAANIDTDISEFIDLTIDAKDEIKRLQKALKDIAAIRNTVWK